MEVIDAIYSRRSIKQFDPDHKMTADEEKKLFEAVLQAPTSFNIQHWRFIVLRDPTLRAKIRTEFGNDQSQMTDAFTAGAVHRRRKCMEERTGEILAKCSARSF